MAGIQLAAPVRTATRPFNDVERMAIERANTPSDFVVMHINPQRINIRYRKVIQRVQTNTRWVFQHWGAEPVTLTYNGLTGYMNSEVAQEYSRKYLPNQITSLRDAREARKFLTPYETNAYRALLRLKTFYEEPHKWLQGRDLTKIAGANIDDRLQGLKLNLYYRDTMYVGYFTRMEIREEETSPWMWAYSMEFTAYDTQSSPWQGQLTSWERDALAEAAKEAGIEVDKVLARASKLVEKSAPSTKGTIPPGPARWGPAAASEQAWKKESYTRTPQFNANLVRKNLLTVQTSDEESE